MPQIGPLEILVVAMLALIVFGPEKLPGMARSIGKALSELRRMATEVKSDFEVGLEDDLDEESSGRTGESPKPETDVGPK